MYPLKTLLICAHPIITFLKVWNNCPWTGFVSNHLRSRTILYNDISIFYLIAMCFEFQVHESRPLFSIQISDSLSLANTFHLILYPCPSMNKFLKIVRSNASLVPTNLHSVELLVFIFCLLDLVSITSVPIVMTDPMWPRMSVSCTACAESTIVSILCKSPFL